MNRLPQSVPWYNPPRILLNAIVISLITYVVLRAVYVSITYDEAATFFFYIKRPISETLNVTYTNNHLLNSLLARFTSNVFGDSEISLRLPNVTGGALFFIFGARLLVRMQANYWLAIAAFVALAFNELVIDFLGICRGYGLSLGLLMTAMYYQYRSFSVKQPLLYESISLLFCAAAVLANYTLINFFLLHTAFNLLMSTRRMFNLRKERRKFLYHLPGYLLFIAGLALFINYILHMLFNLNQLGSLNFGGTDGLWKDSIRSLAIFSCFPILDGRSWIAEVYVPILTGIVLLLAAFMCIRVFLRKTFSANELFMLFLFLTVTGCGVAIVLQNKLMGIPFSCDRTVIYFIPLFYLLGLVLLCNENRFLWWRRTIIILFFLPMIASQLLNFNLEKVDSWWNDAEMEKAAALVIENAKQYAEEKHPAVVVVSFDNYPALRYYLHVNECYYIQPILFAQREWWNLADFSIDDPGSGNMFPDAPYEEIGVAANKTIKRRITPVHYEAERAIGYIDFETNERENRPWGPGCNSPAADYLDGDQNFSLFIRDSIVDSAGIRNVYLFSCNLLAEKVPAVVFGVMTIKRGDEYIMWKPYECVSHLREANEWKEVVFLMHADVEILPGDELDFYVMKGGDDVMRVDNLRVSGFDVK